MGKPNILHNCSGNLGLAVKLCKELFSKFDEIWLIGHKGDLHFPLVEMGVLDDKDKSIKLAHVQSSLGLEAVNMIIPPKSSFTSMESTISQLSPRVIDFVKKVKLKKLKVCVLMPFPNLKFCKIINKLGNNFTITPPARTYKEYLTIENKITMSKLIDELAIENPNLRSIVIPWVNINQLGREFSKYKKYFDLTENQGIYFQKDISAGGSGTKLIKCQADINRLFKDKLWNRLANQSRIKVSVEILNAYPANGSACIIPKENGTCVVLVDPLSHKPIGPNKSSIGNDWSIPWPRCVQSQYLLSAKLIGEELYKKFGYAGIFGPDYIVEMNKNGEFKLKLTEINPRWQGTTPYQTVNALMARRIPLELIHYVIKLDENGESIGKLLQLINNPDLYNQISVGSRGCYYIKLMSPRENKIIQREINGCYFYRKNTLKGPLSHNYSYLCNSLKSTWVNIKAPRKNEIVGPSITAVGYVWGCSSRAVFSAKTPNFTSYGRKLYQLSSRMLYE